MSDNKAPNRDTVDGEQLEHAAKLGKQALSRIREYAGTIMTDWQLATALTHLADMAVDGRSDIPNMHELRAFYLRTRQVLLTGLPLDLQARIEGEDKVERRENIESLERLTSARNCRVQVKSTSSGEPSDDDERCEGRYYSD